MTSSMSLQHRGRRALLDVLVEHAPWALPMLGVALLINNSIRSISSKHVDAQAQARTRARLPRLKRLKAGSTAQQSAAVCAAEDVQLVDQGQEADEVRSETSLLLDAVQTPAALMEWFQEDEVEAMQQAKAGQAQLLQMLRQHGMRMLLEEAADSDNSEGMPPDSLDSLSQLSLPRPSAANAHSSLSTAGRGAHDRASSSRLGLPEVATGEQPHDKSADPNSLNSANAGGYYLDGDDDTDLTGSEWDTDSQLSYQWSLQDYSPEAARFLRSAGANRAPVSAAGMSAEGEAAAAASSAPYAPASSGSLSIGSESDGDGSEDGGGYYIRRRRLPGDTGDGAAGPWDNADGGGYYMPYAPSPPDCDPLDFMPDYEPDFDLDDEFEAYGRALSFGGMAGEAAPGEGAGGDGFVLGGQPDGEADGQRAELDGLLHALIARARQGRRESWPSDAEAASD